MAFSPIATIDWKYLEREIKKSGGRKPVCRTAVEIVELDDIREQKRTNMLEVL